MNKTQSKPTPGTQSLEPQEIQIRLQRLDRKQWWMWSSAFMVIILLTVGVASFSFPALLRQEEATYSFFLNQAVRALIGLVLLFSVYMVYQQLLISKLRSQLSEQIVSLAKVEDLATEVYKLAALDPLTGLYNRRSGEQRLAEEMSRAQRHGRPLTILLLDLDGLKQVNDSYGHAAGDLLLKSFAERLNRAIRGSDLAVRMGGDEFLVLLPECRPEEVRHVLNRLQGLEINYNGEAIPARFSTGWADRKPGETPEEFLKRADEALYSHKRTPKEQRTAKLPVSHSTIS